MHYYGVDLRDLFREEDPLEPRWVLALILGLPMESAYIAERRGGQQFRGWGPATYAAAQTVTTLRGIQHLYILSHIDKKAKKPKPPVPFPTPESTNSKQESKPRNAFAATANAMIAASRRKKTGG